MTGIALAVLSGVLLWAAVVASEPTSEVQQAGRTLQGTFVYSPQRDEVLFQPDGWAVPYLPLPSELQDYLDHPIAEVPKPRTLVPIAPAP